MAHVIGRGRNARETYPEPIRSAGATGPTGPAGGGASTAQRGYDQIENGYAFTITSGNFVPLYREIVGEEGIPLQVELDGVTPGDVIEVSYDLAARSNADDPAESVELRAFAIVAYDNPNPTYPDDFFTIANSGSTTIITDANTAKGGMAGSGSFVIPDGVSNVKIQLAFSTNGGGTGIQFAGVNDMFDDNDNVGTGARLRAEEVPIAEVAQVGPGNANDPV